MSAYVGAVGDDSYLDRVEKAMEHAAKKVSKAIDKGDYEAVVKAINKGDEKIVDAVAR